MLKGYSGGMRRRLDLAASPDDAPSGAVPRRTDDRPRPDEPAAGVGCRARPLGGGVTVLFTTQYLEEADALADRIVVVDHGRVIADGTPLELKEASRAPASR